MSADCNTVENIHFKGLPENGIKNEEETTEQRTSSYVSSLLKTLPESASSFIKTFKRKRPRLRRAMWRLQRMAAEARLMEEKSKKLRVVVLVSAAGGAAALFTGSFSLSLLGALVLCVSGVVTAAGYIKKHFTQQEGSRKDVKTFLRIVEELHRELEEIKKLCEDLQRESVRAETGNIQTLRDDIDELLNSSAKLKLFTGLDSVTELCDHCERAVREFEQMKRRLRDFRGSSDTEMQENSWRTLRSCSEKDQQRQREPSEL